MSWQAGVLPDISQPTFVTIPRSPAKAPAEVETAKDVAQASAIQIEGAKLELAVDSGFSKSDKVTNNGQVNVSGIAADASWQWSADGGKQWSDQKTGPGGTIVVSGDGAKSVIVRVEDKGGKVSTSQLDFILDTVAAAPISAKNDFDTGQVLLTGTAETGARVNVRDGDFLRLSTQASQKDGIWEIPLQWKRHISGLTKVDGSTSSANGEYFALSAAETQNLKQSFSGDFSPTGKAVLDTAREAYSMVSSRETWYLWAQVGGGYLISRLSSTDEWYREKNFSRDSKSALNSPSAWEAISAPAQYLATEVPLADGTRSHQNVLPSLRISAMPKANRLFIQQEDLAGNLSAELDWFFEGENTSAMRFTPDLGKSEREPISQRYVTSNDLSVGTSFAPSAKLSSPADMYPDSIKFTLSGNGPQLARSNELYFEPTRTVDFFGIRTWEINDVTNLKVVSRYEFGRETAVIEHSGIGSSLDKGEVERAELPGVHQGYLGRMGGRGRYGQCQYDFFTVQELSKLRPAAERRQEFCAGASGWTLRQGRHLQLHLDPGRQGRNAQPQGWRQCGQSGHA
ncbi:Ig-like domain-containing protein [Herbaspirillum sp. VT-16-41]|uniref:Ig-like domain-containing protein n=1 Tax=Herbaspirillum sp. VT-16-41 TaxID=1953765 RepID=UPI00111591E8|nr:Ig-like domain-containing protein [Herbaspirillum sp. VT-16-41]